MLCSRICENDKIASKNILQFRGMEEITQVFNSCVFEIWWLPKGQKDDVCSPISSHICPEIQEWIDKVADGWFGKLGLTSEALLGDPWNPDRIEE